MKIYLDVCCLNRPFDDQNQERIRLESEAVLTIFGRCLSEGLTLMGSEMIDLEISKIPDEDRRQKVGLLASFSKLKTEVNDTTINRAKVLNRIGFKPFDAFHIACAEKG